MTVIGCGGRRRAIGWFVEDESHEGSHPHAKITTIGLDIAKNLFQVHGIDAAEKVIVRKQLRRGKIIAFFEALAPCLVGMEACATSHHWRVDEAGPRGPPDAGEECEGLRQAQ